MNWFGHYWANYGGVRAVAKSGYLWSGLALTLVCSPAWMTPNWPGSVLAVLPSILGFSLGGYAVFLGFGEKAFQKFTAYPTPKNGSLYLEASATFLHFIGLQILAILFAIWMSSWLGGRNCCSLDAVMNQELQAFDYAVLAVSAIGFFLFLYSILAALAAAFALFKLSVIYHAWLVGPSNNSNK